MRFKDLNIETFLVILARGSPLNKSNFYKNESIYISFDTIPITCKNKLFKIIIVLCREKRNRN